MIFQEQDFQRYGYRSLLSCDSAGFQELIQEADFQFDTVQGPVVSNRIQLSTVHRLKQHEIDNSNNLSTSYNTTLDNFALIANTSVHEAQVGVSHVSVNYATVTDFEVDNFIYNQEVVTTRYASAIELVGLLNRIKEFIISS